MLLKRRGHNKNFITLFTSNLQYRLNLTKRVTGSLVNYKCCFSAKILDLLTFPNQPGNLTHLNRQYNIYICSC